MLFQLRGNLDFPDFLQKCFYRLQDNSEDINLYEKLHHPVRSNRRRVDVRRVKGQNVSEESSDRARVHFIFVLIANDEVKEESVANLINSLQL